MEKTDRNVIPEVMAMFALCFLIKGIEFLYIKTDRTFIGENVICKVACIIATVLVTLRAGYKLSDIGFRRRNVAGYALCGLALGITTFAASYGIEMLFLSLTGREPRLSVYITNFGLTGATNEISLSFRALAICLLGNIINVLAEEGMFRGIMLKAASDRWGFTKGNLMQAFLFGFWHIISSVQGVMEGSMTVPTAILFAAGYIVLAGMLAFEWGICVNMTGVLWMGMAEHFFNNFISNALHVLSAGDGGVVEADSLQILRIVLSNVLSLTIVLAIDRKRNKKTGNRS